MHIQVEPSRKSLMNYVVLIPSQLPTI